MPLEETPVQLNPPSSKPYAVTAEHCERMLGLIQREKQETVARLEVLLARERQVSSWLREDKQLMSEKA